MSPVVSTVTCTALGMRSDEKRWLFNCEITGAFPANRSTRSANISFIVIYSNAKSWDWLGLGDTGGGCADGRRGLGAVGGGCAVIDGRRGLGAVGGGCAVIDGRCGLGAVGGGCAVCESGRGFFSVDTNGWGCPLCDNDLGLGAVGGGDFSVFCDEPINSNWYN